MKRIITRASFVLAMLLLPFLTVSTAYSQDAFFKGKTMRIIVDYFVLSGPARLKRICVDHLGEAFVSLKS